MKEKIPKLFEKKKILASILSAQEEFSTCEKHSLQKKKSVSLLSPVFLIRISLSPSESFIKIMEFDEK